jgi:DNA polymerase III sliding clamp (beta) subunit (PCNA family)
VITCMRAEVPAILALAIIAAAALFGCALAWTHDHLQRKAFEDTLSETERAQFIDYRLVLPWRHFANVVELDRANIETALEGISSLSDRVRVLRQKIRAARAA